MIINTNSVASVVNRKDSLDTMIKAAEALVKNNGALVSVMLKGSLIAAARKWAEKQLAGTGVDTPENIATAMLSYNEAMVSLTDEDYAFTEDAILICDATGDTNNVQSVTVIVGDDTYRVDLTEKSISKLSIGWVISNGRKQGRRRTSEEIKTIRAWAVANGSMREGSKGRIPQEIKDAYYEALNPTESE